MNSLATLESLAQRYEHNATIRALVQLIPMSIGSAIDTALLTRLQAMRIERARVFFDELAKGEQQLSPELLKNNDFLHCYFSTTAAVLRTHRTEKIQMLARILGAATKNGNFAVIDEYEEFLTILDDLSHRELLVLATLAKYEALHPQGNDENDLQRANRFWDSFTDELVHRLEIRPAEVDSLLTRLSRSGCYEAFTGGYYSYTGGKGKITPMFHRLKDLAVVDFS